MLFAWMGLWSSLQKLSNIIASTLFATVRNFLKLDGFPLQFTLLLFLFLKRINLATSLTLNLLASVIFENFYQILSTRIGPLLPTRAINVLSLKVWKVMILI